MAVEEVYFNLSANQNSHFSEQWKAHRKDLTVTGGNHWTNLTLVGVSSDGNSIYCIEVILI